MAQAGEALVAGNTPRGIRKRLNTARSAPLPSPLPGPRPHRSVRMG